MKCSEFRKWLLAQGVEIGKMGGNNHYPLYYNGKRSTFPDHGAKEIAKGTAEGIKKQLGLK